MKNAVLILRIAAFLLLLPVLHFGQGIQVVEHRRAGSGTPAADEVLYLTTTIRNTSTYPLTTAGLASFKTAVENKMLSLTVNCPNGSQTVYPVGATLPSLAPCASLTTAMLDARYTYNSATRSLDIDAASANGLRLKIEPVQGGILAMQSGANQPLTVNTYYPAGVLTGQGNFTQTWGFRATTIIGSGVPQLPYRLTWQRVSDNVTFAYTFIPTNGSRKMLFSATNSSPPDCNYTLAATGASVSCGQPASLSVSSAGTSTTGLTYAWSGNGFSGNGATVSVSPPSVNGSYAYIVTATKAGCSAKVASATVVVTGCSSVPDPVAFNYPVPTTQADWTGFNSTNLNGFIVGQVFTRESEFLKMEIRKEYGAAIQIFDKLAGNHAIFNYHDHGRSSEPTLYGGPSNYSVDAGNQWFNIGWNPITVGNEGGAFAVGSPVQWLGIVTDNQGLEWIYTKIQMVSWPHIPLRLLEVYSEQWRRLDGKNVHTHFRETLFRSDKTFYEVRQQEWPCFMMSGNTGSVHFYNGTAPFTGAGYVSTNTIESGSIQGGNAVSWEQKAFHISEPWQAMQFKPNRYVGMWTPNYYTTTNNRYVLPTDIADNEGANATTYMTNLPNLILDSDGVYTGQYSFRVDNSVESIRNWANAMPRMTKPDFLFSRLKGRNEWYIFKGYDQKMPFTADNWKVTFIGEGASAQGAKLMSPVGSWKATDSPFIYVRMKYSGVPTTLYLTWLLTGQQADGQSPEYPNQNAVRNPNGVRTPLTQRMAFTVTSDNQFRTYAIPIGTSSLYKDYIQQIEIGNEGTSFVSPGQQFEIVYIGANNPGN